MNMFARFDENPAMTLQDIKETKCYGWTKPRTHGQVKTVYPPETKFAGGIIIHEDSQGFNFFGILRGQNFEKKYPSPPPPTPIFFPELSFSHHTSKLHGYMVTFYYHCILFLLQFNGNSMCVIAHCFFNQLKMP